jgi:hypothetical protein
MDVVASLALARDEAPASDCPNCWECQVDGKWFVAVNAHPNPRLNSRGLKIAAYYAYVEFEGQMVGLFASYKGTFSTDERCDIEAFRSAVSEHVKARS